MEGLVAAIWEILAMMIMGIIELTVCLAVAVVGPVRFCFSTSYRKKVLDSWQGHPGEAVLTIAGGVFVVGCLGLMLWFWSPLAVDLAHRVWDPNGAAAKRTEAEKSDGYRAYVLEKAKELIQRRNEAKKESTPQE